MQGILKIYSDSHLTDWRQSLSPPSWHDFPQIYATSLRKRFIFWNIHITPRSFSFDFGPFFNSFSIQIPNFINCNIGCICLEFISVCISNGLGQLYTSVGVHHHSQYRGEHLDAEALWFDILICTKRNWSDLYGSC